MHPTKVIFVFLVLLSFKTSAQNHIVEETFTKDEIEDLNKIVRFFTDQMCSTQLTFEVCMEKYSDELVEYGWQPILNIIDFKDQLDLYKNLKSNIFEEIWTFCKSYNPDEGWERKSICYQPEGKYNDFLIRLGEENQIINAYHNDLISSGDFMGLTRLENEIFNKTDRIKLNNQAIQIILTIHYLSMNDQQKRKEDWLEK